MWPLLQVSVPIFLQSGESREELETVSQKKQFLDYSLLSHMFVFQKLEIKKKKKSYVLRQVRTSGSVRSEGHWCWRSSEDWKGGSWHGLTVAAQSVIAWPVYPGTLQPSGKDFRASVTNSLGKDVPLPLHPLQNLQWFLRMVGAQNIIAEYLSWPLTGLFGSFTSTELCLLCFIHSLIWQTWLLSDLLLIMLSQMYPRDKVSWPLPKRIVLPGLWPYSSCAQSELMNKCTWDMTSYL